MNKTDLATEWRFMQKQFDLYEFGSLAIKLLSILIVTLALPFTTVAFIPVFITAILWLQDAIFKTFQSRIESHLLYLESELAKPEADTEQSAKAYQFNTRYEQARPGTLGLVKEYIAQAMRPTVAYPYVALIVLALVVGV